MSVGLVTYRMETLEMDDFRQISDCLPAWLTAEGMKGTRTKARAKSQGDRPLPAKEVHANRCMTTAFPNGLPRPAVVIHLVVIEGSGRRAGGGSRSPAIRCSPRERTSELKLRVV